MGELGGDFPLFGLWENRKGDFPIAINSSYYQNHKIIMKSIKSLNYKKSGEI